MTADVQVKSPTASIPSTDRDLLFGRSRGKARTQMESFETLPEVRRTGRTPLGWYVSYCRPDHKVSLGFMEGLNNKIRVIQRRSYGLKDMEYLKLKVLTSFIEDW